MLKGDNMIDVFIIGAGVSGMTAAIYVKRAGYNVKIVEKHMYGGQIIQTNEIENYPGFSHIDGPTLAMNLNDQLKNLDIAIDSEEVTKIEKQENSFKIFTSKDEYEAKAVIVATGSREKKLGLDNEDRLVGRGISYCATCDGSFYKGKRVAVVGGKNTAMCSAITLSKTAEKVYILVRKDEIYGDIVNRDKLVGLDNVEVLFETEVKVINGDDKLESIEVLSKKEKKTLEIDALFMAIGSIPNLEFLGSYLELDKFNYLKADETMQTSVAGIFASGDCRSKEIRQLTTAVSDGTISALSAVDYIEKNKL